MYANRRPDDQHVCCNRYVLLNDALITIEPGLGGSARASDLSQALEPTKPYAKARLGSYFDS